jgi:penicillin V acylase-like amidase (Ntn superfamily)
MRRKTISIIVLFVFIALTISSANSLACSTFILKKDTTFIFGHNLDERADIPGYVFINKRGVQKTNFKPWDYLWSIKTPRIQWVSKYGSITFNANGRDFADGGINEAGLYIWEMTLMETKYPQDNSKPHLIVDQWIQYQLDNYQSVTEVLQNLAEVAPYTNAWHFLIADQQGSCATIEFIEGNPVVHTDQSLPITVLCNSQYDLEIKELRKYTGFGGWRDPFWTLSPGFGDNRFVQAAAMIRDYVPGKAKSAVKYGFDILKQMERGGNRWQVIIDVPNSMVYFNTSLLRKLKYFSYKNLDFSPDSPVQIFDVYSKVTGDISKRFGNFS